MIQVVAYGQSSDTPTYLDIQDAPGISLNFAFADVRDPSKRNASYSHTFKLPFTQNNNQFFEQLFEVNLDAATFNPQKKTDAIILLNTIPQLKGILQIKNILTKAQLYEVAVFGEGGDLFSEMKDKTLQDAFTDADDVTFLTTWNHTLTYTNIYNSWSGTLTNTVGATTADILYPIVDYGRSNLTGFGLDINFTYTPQFLVQTNVGFKDAMIRPYQQRPAIKLKTILQQIFIKAGFSYTSAFIDGSYFGKLWVLLATQTEDFATDPIGGCKIGLTSDFTLTPNNNPVTVAFDKETPTATFYDVDDVWDSSIGFTCAVPGEYKFGYGIKLITDNSGQANDYPSVYGFLFKNGQQIEYKMTHLPGGVSGASDWTGTLVDEFSGLFLEVGDVVTFQLKNNSDATDGTGIDISIRAYDSATDIGSYFELLGSNTTHENRTVFIPDNMPDLKQSDFLKDIIQRFNLVIVPDQEASNHLYIEPFEDYIDAGSQKDWEDKLDKSKEIQVKFTNELMNQSIEFKDLDDDDQTNFYHERTFKENYSYYRQENRNKEFAKDEPLENDSVFSPFIPVELQGDDIPIGLDSFLIHRSYSVEGGGVSPQTTEPKLFHYSGTPTTISAFYSWYDGVNQSVENIAVYPYCSNFDSAPVTAATKDLRWGGGYPYAFNSPQINATYTQQNLFNVYWSRYINEIYSDDARIMTAYVNLDAQDILNFKFSDQIFINNCFWRVNKISDYQIGEIATTKIEFIKLIVKTAHDCTQEPGTFNADGTIDFISTADGSAVTETQECCEEWNYWWNLTTSTCNWKSFHSKGYLQKSQIARIAKSMNNTNLKIGSSNYQHASPDSLILSTRDKTNSFNAGMMIITYTGQTDDASVKEIFIQGISGQRFQVPVNTFCTLNATMASVQSGLDNNTGSIGSSSYVVYNGAIKNVNGTITKVGSGAEEYEFKDSDAGTRELTFDVLNTGGNQALTVNVEGEANRRILWSIDIKIEYNEFVVYNTNAIWMDDNNIIFQDGDQMLWN